MHRDAYVQRFPETLAQGGNCSDDIESSANGSLRVVFVRKRIAEVDENPVANEPRDAAFVAFDHLGADSFILAREIIQFFGIELSGQRGRVDKVTEYER